jgi:hypothetical protein
MKKIIIGGFVVLALVFAALIVKLVTDDKQNWIAEKATHSAIVSMYGRYKEGSNFRTMELSDGQTFTIPQNLLGKLSVGDSVFKEREQSFYRFKIMKSQ